VTVTVTDTARDGIVHGETVGEPSEVQNTPPLPRPEATPRPKPLFHSGRLWTELILAVGEVQEVVLVFGLGLPEEAGLADLGHDLAGPDA
jgi:hypothetical protein